MTKLAVALGWQLFGTWFRQPPVLPAEQILGVDVGNENEVG